MPSSNAGSRTQVTVVEGRIEIIDEQSPLRLVAGEQVRIEDNTRPAAPTTVDVKPATAWTRNEVAFAGERLEDVAAQFNRYTGARIAIEDAGLRDYRVSGVFQAYDLDSFVAYLSRFEGIAVERNGEEIRVRNRKER